MTEQYNKPDFRSDINGLRAWACLAVVFFHFKILHFQGGFVGVDVFFVISGYLMTAILYPKLASQQINILQFYTQRLKRVFPALFFMLLVLISVGSFILYSRDFYHLIREVIASLGFHYNIRFQDTDYFSEATTDWLTHTWTLGLEFQFYILFPILLLFINKITKNTKHHIWALLLISLLSFVGMQYQVHLNPNQAFFLLQYRVWEFLAGAILFLTQYRQTNIISQKYVNIILILGWSSLITFFVLVDDAGHYPDYRTLVPILATVAILYPIKNTLLTKNVAIQFLGSASYSIYLWHWCIYVLIGLYGYHNNDVTLYLFALLSIIVGCISYLWVEKGLNKLLNKITDYKKQFILLFSVMLITIIILTPLRKEGAVSWVEKNSQNIADITRFKDDKFIHAMECHDNQRTDCIFGDVTAEVGFILIGDSHSPSLLAILDKMAKEHKTAIATFMASACPVAFNMQAVRGTKSEESALFCLENLKNFKQGLQNYPNAKVLIVNRNNLYLLGHNENSIGVLTHYYYKEPIDKKSKQSIKQWQEDLSVDLIDSVCQISKTHQVYWFKPTAEMGFDVPKTLAQNIFYRKDNSDIKIPVSEHQKRQHLIDPIQKQVAQDCGVNIVDINPAFCDDKYCYGSSGRQVYYYDDDHLSITGSYIARPYLEFLFNTK